MTTTDPLNHPSTGDATGTRAQLFTVRLWAEDIGDATEYRGQVRDVVSGAYRGFRHWSELTEFMEARVNDHLSAKHTEAKRESLR
jgi:hypothetical protein